MNEPIDASVVVCTRNRAAVLGDALRHLLAAGGGPLSWELVVVDNASTDGTRRLVEELAAGAAPPVRVVEEREIGLSAARNAGVGAARGAAVVFLDDDAFPVAGWLEALARALDGEGVYAAGGPVEPRFQRPLPDWCSRRFLPYLTVWDPGAERLDLRYNEYPRGANMAFRREAFERFGLFSPHLGRKASSLLSCEEIELCLRIERGGGRIVYEPAARVEHLVDGSRVTPRWLALRFRSQGRSEAILEWRHAGAAGLAVGLRRALRKAVGGPRRREGAGPLERRCDLEALRGYLQGLLAAPFVVPRYRPSPEAGPARGWRPFS